ncbi:hypothetical protein M1328_04510 [Patescibacteria group bacterium]|nr:hypothetical protein [Patescibacteria group bacterium]
MKKYFSALIVLVLLGFGLYYLSRVKETVPSVNQTNTVSTGVTPTVSEEKPILSGMSLEVTSPVDKSTVSTPTVNVSGKTSPGADVFVNEKQLKADNQGNFSVNYNLLEGENDFYITVNDSFGNYAEKMIVVNLQSTQ